MGPVARLACLTVASCTLFTGLTNAQRIADGDLCALLPQAEVKALLGAGDAFDRVTPRPWAGKTGYSCRYDALSVVVHDGAPHTPPQNAELLTGVGKEAFVVTSPGRVELFANLDIDRPYSKLTMTRTLDASGSPERAKAAVVAIAKTLIPKLK